MKVQKLLLLRVQVIMVCWINVIVSDSSRTRNENRKEASKYPLEIHQLFQDKLSKRKLPSLGTWSSWSPWTPCSRSCGGGVTQQTRRCIPITNSSQKFNGKPAKSKTEKYCVGRYKRFHVCNIQECPTPVDFRRQQCMFFNKYPFRGQLFSWEPFLQAPDECALNCRPSGTNFFATLKKTVIDGTPCYHPFTATGRPAPPGTKGICVDRKCMSVASNGVIGALDEEPEECQACARGACQTFSGIYQRLDVPPGYSLVTEIPAGACKIFVRQIRHTKNHLALKYPNDSYIINGDWKFNHNHHSIEAAGTRFTYKKQDTTSTEMITAPGPLSTPVEIMIVVQQINEGVKYDYSLPITSNEIPQIAPPLIKQSPMEPSNLEPRRLNIPFNSNTQKDEPKTSSPHRRRARRRFIWKHAGFSPCTKSCGGGVQTTTFICMREHNQMAVSERRCANLEKPPVQQVRCNIHACPPQWKSSWATCTGSCGQGIQQLIHRCEQEIAPGKYTIVNEVGCPQPKPLSETKQCTLPPCSDTFDNELQPSISPRLGNDLQEWAVGIWSQCSATCGSGHKTRAVTCPSGRCNPEHRPPHLERCQTTPCPDSSTRSSWLTSEWGECSTLCGTGTQTRQSFCFETSCENDLKPEETRACSTYKLCNGQWFTGPWGPCSDSCNGPARQRRDVHCIIKIRGQPHVTNDMTCNQSEKPYEEQACYGTCSPKWFSSDWGDCEGGCSSGIHRRDVRCLDSQGRHATTCKADDMPPFRKPCTCKSSEDPSIHILPQDEPVDNTCVDKLQICTAAMQARLCQYPYYINNCCRSCKKFKQDGL